MTKLSRAAFSIALDVTAAPSPDGAWMRILPAGDISGRTGRQFHVGDEAAMAAIVAATRRRSGSTDLAVDYDHQTVFGAVPGVGGRAPASGWMRELDVRPDGIWARVAWTQSAAAAIGAAEYRYFSPTFLHDAAGRVRVLTGGALTNNPDLDLPVAMSAVGDDIDGASMEKIAKALGLAEDATEDQILAALNTALAGQVTLTKIAETAGKAGAFGDDLVVAVQSAIAAGAKPDPTKYVPIAAVAALQAELAALSTGTKAADVKAAVDKAVADGKLTPALKDWATDFATRDLVAFSAFVTAAPRVVTPGGGADTRGKPPAGDGGALTETEIAVCSAMGLSHEDFKKSRDSNAKETR